MTQSAVVFKKTSQNGKITTYLTKRDFVDNLKETSSVEGVAVLDRAMMTGKSLHVKAVVRYRYGREEDETMGLHFAREFELMNRKAIVPDKPDPLVAKLITKLGAGSTPFTVSLPHHAPLSVILETNDLMHEPLGVTYDLMFYVAPKPEEEPPIRQVVSVAVRKIQIMPFAYMKAIQPKTIISKSFVTATGKLKVDITLPKDIYCQGDTIPVETNINNKSKWSVKSISCKIIQKVDITITRSTVNSTIAEIDSKDGCPVLPGGTMTRVFNILPTAENFRGKKIGIAMDGRVKDADANLACSCLNSSGDLNKDSLGIIISYYIKVIFHCGLGGDFNAKIPFRLVYPVDHKEAAGDLKIEEFSKFRRGKSVDDMDY